MKGGNVSSYISEKSNASSAYTQTADRERYCCQTLLIVEAPSVCSVLSQNTPRLRILIKGEISHDSLGEWMLYDSFHHFLLAEGGGPIQSL